MTGNRLGPRKTYIYTPDVPSTVYLVTTDEDLAVAGLGAGAAAPVEFDPDNPPTGVTILTPPARFRLRTVFAQSSTDGARKNLIAFSPDADLYATSARTAVPAIDTDTSFVTTGRRGEQLSF